MSDVYMIPLTEFVRDMEGIGFKHYISVMKLCREGKVPAIQRVNQWYLAEDYVRQIKEWRETVCCYPLFLDEACDAYGIDKEQRQPFHRALKRRVEALFLKELPAEAVWFNGPFFLKKDEDEIRRTARETALPYQGDGLTLAEAVLETGLSGYILKNMIREGLLTERKDLKGQYILYSDELEKLKEYRAGMTGTFDIARGLCEEIDTLFDPAYGHDRARLAEHLTRTFPGRLVSMEESGMHGDRKNTLFVRLEDLEEVTGEIRKFLLSYGDSSLRFDRMMEDAGWEFFPQTREIFLAFSEGKQRSALCHVAGILLQQMPCEVLDIGDEDAAFLCNLASESGFRMVDKYMCAFLRYVQSMEGCSFHVTIIQRKKKATDRQKNDPYSQEQYFQFAHLLFDPVSIRENHLIEKAWEDPRQALLWLYSSIHYVSGFRRSDMLRIPMKRMSWTREQILMGLDDEAFWKESVFLCDILETAVNNSYTKPKKTENHQNERYLILHIGESLKPVFGIIYGLAGRHYFPTLPEKVSFSFRDFVKFFGEDYIRIFGTHAVSNRRLNKSYLGNIEELVNTVHGSSRYLGYQVAGLPRAHAGGIWNRIPRSTAYYLPHRMDGIPMDDVLVMLFDSGLCSFIPGMLLTILYGDDYEKLPPADQTALIKANGMDSFEAEVVVDAVRKNYLEASKAVSEMVFAKDSELRRDRAAQALENILSCRALGKEMGIHCLCHAVEKACVRPAGSNCFGCSYAIYEKAVWNELTGKIRILADEIRQTQHSGERRKKNMLLRQCYLPAAQTLLVLMEQTYHVDTSVYRKTLVDALKEKTKEEES